jgi:hypothetical protein
MRHLKETGEALSAIGVMRVIKGDIVDESPNMQNIRSLGYGRIRTLIKRHPEDFEILKTEKKKGRRATVKVVYKHRNGVAVCNHG